MPLRSSSRARKLKNKLNRLIHVMAPMLVALSFAGVAHAQGTMDFSGAQTLMGTFNTRLAYVAISRASEDAHIYTNDAAKLGNRLAVDVSKSAAIDLRPVGSTDEIRRAVSAFRDHDPVTGTTILQQQKKVHEYATAEHRLAAVALEYAARQDRVVVVAPDASERHELTQLIRDELRQQGRLSPESRAIPVLVERHLDNPRIAGNYNPGDEIHYRAGSPKEHGIADNSSVTVISVDARSNTLTVATTDNNEVTYNPAHLQKLTDQSHVFVTGLRDLAVGERIVFTATDRASQIRRGDFATVEQIRENAPLSVLNDKGKSIEVPEALSQSIEYGYATESFPRSMQRVLITGDSEALAQQQQQFARITHQTNDLAVFTSPSQGASLEKNVLGKDFGVLSLDAGVAATEQKIPSIDMPELGISR